MNLWRILGGFELVFDDVYELVEDEIDDVDGDN